jgi:hypothetical protein
VILIERTPAGKKDGRGVVSNFASVRCRLCRFKTFFHEGDVFTVQHSQGCLLARINRINWSTVIFIGAVVIEALLYGSIIVMTLHLVFK